MKPQRAVSGTQIVPVKIRPALISGDEKIQISITIEVAVSQTAAHLRCCEPSADSRSYIAEHAVSVIQKKMRRLSIAMIPRDTADRVVDMPVHCGQVEPPVEIDIEECATEAESVAGVAPHA